MKVSIFIPCCVDQFSAQTGFHMIELLNATGIETHYPEGQTCCGQTCYKEGDKEGAKRLAQDFMKNFAHSEYIVGCSSSCIAYMKRYYADLFQNSTHHNTYKKYLDNLYDITDFMVHVVQKVSFNSVFPHKVVFMDNCVTRNDYGLYKEPRLLLEHVQGLELLPMAEEQMCCGFGGMFASRFEPISTEMAKRKIQNAISAGAEYITSTDMGCLLHLKSYINKAKLPIQCIHIVDILASHE